VHEDAIDVEHEVANGCTIKVPKIKGITDAAVDAMMNFDVRSSKIPWNIAEEDAEAVFEYITEGLLEPRAI
jgi:hypothetical protein